MPLLTDEQSAYLRDVFEKELVKEVTITLFSQPTTNLIVPGNEQQSQFCAEANEIVETVAALSDKIRVDHIDYRSDTDKVREFDVKHVPALFIGVDGQHTARFLGVPSGYEFSTLVQDIVDVSTDLIELSESTQEFLRNLEENVHLQVFVTPSCPYCPQAARMAAHMAAVNPARVKAVTIEATEFPDLARYYQVRAVPRIVINDKVAFDGALPERQFMAEVLKALGKTEVEEE